eukprot:1148878-Pelagomonas_calceolata.AAC.2
MHEGKTQQRLTWHQRPNSIKDPTAPHLASKTQQRLTWHQRPNSASPGIKFELQHAIFLACIVAAYVHQKGIAVLQGQQCLHLKRVQLPRVAAIPASSASHKQPKLFAGTKRGARSHLKVLAQ